MKEKLLVLDDEALILASLEHLFEDDYEVLTASDAGTALRLSLEFDIAVILCDERMPGVCGHEFLRQVREVSRATRVMMSGYADMSALTEAVNAGQIFAYVAKPWEPLKIKAQVSVAVTHFKLVREVEHERGLLRALMENIPDSIYFKDRQSRFTRVNRAHARLLGAADPAAVLGRSDADFFAAADALRWLRQEQEIVDSGRVQADSIERFESPSGGAGWWSTTKVPMFDRSGQVTGIAGISRDIGTLKRNEDKLREQSEYNRMILETAHDAFLGMDPDGRIAAWNPQAERTFGWTAAEALGRPLKEFLSAPPAGDGEAEKPFPAGLVSRQAIELAAFHRNGREFPVEATVWPVRAGGASGFHAFVRDISDRRRAEIARRKEAALVQLLQSVAVAANRSSTIEQAAQACLERICAHLEWPVGHAYLRAGQHAGQHAGHDAGHDAGGTASTGIWELAGMDRFDGLRAACDGWGFAAGPGLAGRIVASGQPEWIADLNGDPLGNEAAAREGLRSGFGFPVQVDDRVIGILEFYSPQTQLRDEQLLAILGSVGSQLGQVIVRQRAEQELQRSKASAESANRIKSEFLTTMSHEMRTPMNAILGMADLLAESALSEEQRKYIRVFQKAGANLLVLINDLLDLSKVEAGRIELESIAFELRPLLEKAIEIMSSRARDRGLQLTLEILPGVPPALRGDPNRLRQILLNLIGNALKFTEQGSVTVRVEPEPGAEPGRLCFEVADTGIGIPAEKTEMIFGRFTQADSSTTRKYGGSGLGLAITKGLVEMMDGRVGCRSEVGRGSTFFFTARFEVPASGEIAAEGEATGLPIESTGVLPDSVLPDAAGGFPDAAGGLRDTASRVLIVDDDEFNVLLIQAYLGDGGYQTDVADNGLAGVEKVKSGRPDVVLMDMQMPGMDGLEATRAIRAWEAATGSRPVPILALTADATGDGAGRSREAGCNEHLTKPIKKIILLEALARHGNGMIRVTPPEGMEALAPSYLIAVRHAIGQIRDGVEAKDWMPARRLGHQFKGSGAGYGFPEVTRAGAALEQAGIEANENEIRNQLLALAAYLDRVEIVTAQPAAV